MVKTRAKKRGWTLVETLVVTAIIGVVALITPRLYLQIRRFLFLSNARVELQRDGRDVLGQITKRIRQAQSNSIAISRYGSQPPFSKIDFTDINGDSIGYYQSGRSLYMMVDGSTKTLTSNLRYVSFLFPRSDDMSIISVALTLEKSTFEGRTKFLHMASEKVRVMN
jgi:prepilin-type N-terminal cleavage/methylation domain-containing protein